MFLLYWGTQRGTGMAIHKLSSRKIETAKPGKYEDGGGLRLVVSNAGARKWVLRFTINGKRREMGLGSYPDVGLAEVRDKSTEYRKKAKKGVDPIETRQIEPAQTPTFTTCAARYIRGHRRSWKNAKHARQWVSTLKTYARPEIGSTYKENNRSIPLSRQSIGSRIRRNYLPARPLNSSTPWIFS